MAKKDNSAPIKSWPADDVQRRPVAELVPYARNARTHSPVQVDQIAASIREWGWTMPVLVDEDSGIIAGHGRVLAAQKLGLYDVPVMVARGWTAAQKRAYVLADNKLALNAGWDDETLKLELEDLNTDGFDLGLTGFSGDEIVAFLVDVIALDGMPGLPIGDKEPFQQITFTVHDDQAEQIKAALDVARGLGEFVDSPNENSNGNALARVCEIFLSHAHR